MASININEEVLADIERTVVNVSSVLNSLSDRYDKVHADAELKPIINDIKSNCGGQKSEYEYEAMAAYHWMLENYTILASSIRLMAFTLERTANQLVNEEYNADEVKSA